METEDEGHDEAASVVIRRRVEWVDTDAAGIAHWLACLRLVEVAESALHTSLGTADDLLGSLPRLAASITYHGPLRFNDVATVDLGVDAVGTSSLRYAFSISGPDGAVASGTLDTCLVDPTSNRPRPLPGDVRERLRAGGPQTPGDGR
ncbi:MAG TPA: thioesterase family protein [Baekduia sp.]|nr:thioesterase family protein [Baekduia sp.]